jgi:oligoribonuclease NrnB/cAMP/cGMP phosphodiesterase (DHH superfamily)
MRKYLAIPYDPNQNITWLTHHKYTRIEKNGRQKDYRIGIVPANRNDQGIYEGTDALLEWLYENGQYVPDNVHI